MEIMNTIGKFMTNVKFAAIENSPKLLIAGAIVAGAGAIVGAIVGTKKAIPVIEEAKIKIEEIHLDEEGNEKAELSKEDAQAMTRVYLDTAWYLTKVYAPTILLSATSITCMLGSNNIMMRRNAALSAAFTAVDTSFREYRKRVAGAIGDEAEMKLYRNERVELEQTETVDPETGEVKTETKEIKKIDTAPHTALFDETNVNYERDPYNNYNLMFLKAHEQAANDKLRATGFMFENEVRDDLGLDRTPEGQFSGWIFDPDGPTHQISFGIFDYNNPAAANFVTDSGREGVWLNFNCSDNIMSRVKW